MPVSTTPSDGPNTGNMRQVVEQLAQDLRAKQARRTAFLSGSVFARLLASLRDSTVPLALSSAELAYERQAVLARLGWLNEDPEDIDLFVDALLDESARTVEPGSVSDDPACSFENMSFRHYGLNVWVMSGQGTAWTLANDAAHEAGAGAPSTTGPSTTTQDLEAALPQVLARMLEAGASDAEATFDALQSSAPAQQALAALREDKLDGFYYPFVYPMRQATRGLARLVHPKDTLAQFIIENLDFVELQVKRFLSDVEGSACCADKMRWVLRSYLRHARTGADIVVDRAQQYTFHLPTRVLCSEQDIVEFLRATMRLYYGHVDHFVTTRDALVAKAHPPL